MRQTGECGSYEVVPSRTVASLLLVAGWGAGPPDVFFFSSSGRPGGGRFSLGVTRVLKPTPAESSTDSLFPFQPASMSRLHHSFMRIQQVIMIRWILLHYHQAVSPFFQSVSSERHLAVASSSRIYFFVQESGCVETVSVTCSSRSLRVASRFGPRHD
jgi:hypothetical protein